MSRLLPHRPAVEAEPTAATVVDLTDDADAARIEALAADTARAILSSLHDEPSTASEVASAVDTSLQNAHYHLTKLADVGLVEVVETWYSSRGSEMPVYAPTIEQMVLTVESGRDGSERPEDDDEEGTLDRDAPTLVA
jgi:DNA-binding transcriptional ArsR family regulator